MCGLPVDINQNVGGLGLPVKGNGCHRNHNNMGMLMEFSISP